MNLTMVYKVKRKPIRVTTFKQKNTEKIQTNKTRIYWKLSKISYRYMSYQFEIFPTIRYNSDWFSFYFKSFQIAEKLPFAQIVQLVINFILIQVLKLREQPSLCFVFSLDIGRNLGVHKTCRRRPGHLLSVLCTFSLHPVSRCIHFYKRITDFITNTTIIQKSDSYNFFDVHKNSLII